MAKLVSVDYLVVGSGAMGMAFVDTLLSDTNATVVIVDRYHQPGGHWTMSYPFVRLHQPSAFYGVNSKHLGQDRIDKVGWNRGLHELATSGEVCAYYAHVMDQAFLTSGRVAYFPKCEHNGDGEWRSLVSGKTFRVGGQTRIVDATFMRVTVPSMRPPPYSVAADVHLVTPNDLVKITRPRANYTVIGAGKTGIDTCLWLLGTGVEASCITWIMPRDAWLLDRASIQPGPPSAHRQNGMTKQGEAIMAATSVDDLFKRLDACGSLLRISEQHWPSMYRCATVSRSELAKLQEIEAVIRKGRVLQIGANEIKLEGGSYTPTPDTLYIDCSADGLAKHTSAPIFNGNRIVLQSVRQCQQVFSAAFIAHIDAAYSDDDKLKNDLCRPIPHPDEAADWLVVAIQTYRNTMRWNAEPSTRAWLAQARLDMFKIFFPPLPEDIEEMRTVLRMLDMQLGALSDKLEKLLAESPLE
ncbi:hypothetical protein LTR85_001089 [Meristemomyces frigidus]|nr:hypothetical protein LTR85_001089 [Meristemomyces frigidus]